MGLEFKRVLCPVDLSAFSLDALRLAVQVAENSGAVLDILHVIHNPFDEIYLKAITQSDPALLEAYAKEPQRRTNFLRATEEEAEVLSKQFSHDTAQALPSSRLHYHIRRGDPFENIVDAAEDYRSDLIVLATHGRTGLKRLAIGSVAEKVVRHAACAVLTVKPRTAV